MGLQTYKYETRYGTFCVKMKKDAAKEMARKINDILSLPAGKHRRELTGIIGGEERSTLLWTTGQGLPMRELESYEADMTAFFSGLPDVITMENYRPILEEKNRIFDKHVAVEDNRKTAEQKAADDETYETIRRQNEKEQNEIYNAFLARFGIPGGEKITIVPGQMAVCLNITVDRSDSMTDYYAPHGHFPGGVRLLLAIVHKQNETEALARRALAMYPELCKHEFQWKTQKYSGGNGNFLESKANREELTAEERRHGGIDTVVGKYEVEFERPYKAAIQIHPYKNYHNRQESSEQNSGEAVGAGAWMMQFNEAKNGVEIWSATKPDAETIKIVSDAGFRWSFSKRRWWAKQSERTIAFAQRISGTAPAEEADPVQEITQGRTIWNSDGTEGPCLICMPPENE